ncbi:MAG: glycosyltransferase [Synechococcaceae cyanobacterium]|jgi:colanic acid biosynthesis glycosyl transferase WcaI
MRILLVNQSSGHLFNPIVASLLRRGHRLTFLAGSIDGPIPAGSPTAPGELEQLQAVAYRRETALLRLITWGLFSLQLALLLLRRGRRFDRVLLVSNPPSTPLLARLLLPRYALLLYDLYPQVLRDMGMLRPTGWAYRLLNRAMAAAVGRAELVVVLSEAMRQEVIEGCRAGGQAAPGPERLLVVPPWADGQLFQPAAAPPAADGPWVVLYGGNLGLTHPLDPLLEAVANLSRQHPIRLELVAAGARLRALRQRWQNHGAIRFLPLEPPAQHGRRLQTVQLAAVCLEPQASGASLPSKSVAALACGTPLLVIARADSALVQMVEQHRCGIWVEPEDRQGLEHQLAELMADPRRLARLRNHALEASAAFSDRRADDLVERWLGQA